MDTTPAADATTTPTDRPKTALIAIHGVADQEPGQFARAVAALLAVPTCASPLADGQGRCDTVLLSAAPIAPMHDPQFVPAAPESPPATRASWPRALAGACRRLAGQVQQALTKAWRQSIRSDFQRDSWVTLQLPSSDDTAAASGRRAAPDPAPPQSPLARDIRFSDYLLFKAWRRARTETFETTRIRITARSGDTHDAISRVDLYEMYWADLSRLSGALPRIVTEVFTMVFRLSRLGRDSVDEAAAVATRQQTCSNEAEQATTRKRWLRLRTLQTALDWSFCHLLANLFLQLLLAGLLCTLFGLAAPHASDVHLLIAIALPAAAAAWICFRYANGAAQCLGAVAGAVAAAVVLLALVPAHAVIGLSALLAAAWSCDRLLQIADERFPGSRLFGQVFLAATMLLLLWHAGLGVTPGDDTAQLRAWGGACMRVIEVLLLLLIAWGAVTTVLLALWWWQGWRLEALGAGAQAAIATGRLGLFMSIASFLMTSMVCWTLLSSLLELGAQDLPHRPLVFFAGYAPVIDGSVFMHERFVAGTRAFALTAGLTLALVVYLFVVLLPSVVVEFKHRFAPADRLDRWLSAGYRHLGGLASVLVVLSVLAAGGVGVALVLAHHPFTFIGRIPGSWSTLTRVSEELLRPFVVGAGGGALAFAALGHMLSRFVPWIRAPLDVVLDVDNHFREFPRRAVSRARIFARYVALLEHIVAQGHDRIVIVAHSQGTVITAELLRYLQARRQRPARSDQTAQDRIGCLAEALSGKLHLLTAGCPLRQLYAARFPDLYSWVTCTPEDGRTGPDPAALGLDQWTNVYTCGDYVGRWLWEPRPLDVCAGTAEHVPSTGGSATAPARAQDVCLGSGAHLRYFDPGQARVAQEIGALLHR